MFTSSVILACLVLFHNLATQFCLSPTNVPFKSIWIRGLVMTQWSKKINRQFCRACQNISQVNALPEEIHSQICCQLIFTTNAAPHPPSGNFIFDMLFIFSHVRLEFGYNLERFIAGQETHLLRNCASRNSLGPHNILSNFSTYYGNLMSITGFIKVYWWII
jgi:hypothetical protein